MKVVQRSFRKLQETLSYHIARIQRQDKDTVKIFCIGRNKTGTTSLASFFRANGYKVGNQEQAELLMEDWVKRDFSRIITYCETAEVFQDIPFSLPNTYKVLDNAFPGSKFILTVRSSPEEWYNSLIAHHSKQMSSTSLPPSEEDLREYAYRKKYKGFILFVQQVVYGYPSIPLYDKAAYTAHYDNHNKTVVKYFKNRPGDLLVINLKEKNSFEQLCHFIELDSRRARTIPHENRSAEINMRRKA